MAGPSILFDARGSADAACDAKRSALLMRELRAAITQNFSRPSSDNLRLGLDSLRSTVTPRFSEFAVFRRSRCADR
jgi:hypothetical protein